MIPAAWPVRSYSAQARDVMEHSHRSGGQLAGRARIRRNHRIEPGTSTSDNEVLIGGLP